MELFPAIDIRSGRVVRLSQGEASRETAYRDDPVEQAEEFAAQGARWIHLVDLDRAFGSGENTSLVAAVAGRVGRVVRLQVGGGLRSLAAIEAIMELEVARVVLGTAAVTDPVVVREAVARFGAARVAAGLDARNGMVATRGWVETSSIPVDDACRRLIQDGIATVVYTDVSRDGMLAGPDLAGAARLRALGVSVVASGGVGRLEEIRDVARAGLEGVIVGRALYEGRFTLAEALAAAQW